LKILERELKSKTVVRFAAKMGKSSAPHTVRGQRISNRFRRCLCFWALALDLGVSDGARLYANRVRVE